jgi:hypothetical protein
MKNIFKFDLAWIEGRKSQAERNGHCGNAAIATRLFFENARLFLKIAWHFNNICRKFEAFF